MKVLRPVFLSQTDMFRSRNTSKVLIFVLISCVMLLHVRLAQDFAQPLAWPVGVLEAYCVTFIYEYC